jgi:ribosome-binding protein aMBF1 (putative translation factor)
VRYAAIETLLAQESDAVRADLARALARRDEESNRVRVRIAEAFNRRGWTLGDLAAGVSERPPVGWRVEGERVVPA